MGGGGQKSTTQETKEIRLPPWVEQASQENYGFAKKVADRPYDYYHGETVAPLNKDFYAARGLTGTLDDYQDYYKDAGTSLQGVMDYNPTNYQASSVAATMLPQMNRAAYTNPLINDVERRAIENARIQGQQAQTQLGAAAAKGGGMGGSRQAIQQAVQGAETTRGIGDLSAKLRKEAYDTATGAMQTDIANKLKAETQTGDWRQQALSEYERNKLAANQEKIAASAGKVSAADSGQQARMNEIATKLGFSQMMQDQRQREDDMRKGMWEGKRNYPLEQLNIRLAALGMSPYGHTESGTSTTRSGGGGGLGQALGIGGQLLGMFAGMSDRDTKTDIEEVGQHPTLPIAVYAYRYKSDPKSYPKVIGPMADEVERVAPHLVKKVGKRRVVDLRALTV
jgi:hypothetical protein